MIVARRERGMITTFVAVTVVGLLGAAGLVLDGGALLAAHRSAADHADAAARAGAQVVDLDALRAGRAGIARGGVAAARRHLAAVGLDGHARVDGDQIVVRVSQRRRTTLLRLVGVDTVTVTATGRARMIRGVSRPEV